MAVINNIVKVVNWLRDLVRRRRSSQNSGGPYIEVNENQGTVNVHVTDVKHGRR